jgi:hypothetical protein
LHGSLWGTERQAGKRVRQRAMLPRDISDDIFGHGRRL